MNEQSTGTTAWAVAQHRTAEYHRPQWMTDQQWQQVSADLTEHWLTLLETAAREASQQGQG